MKRRLVQKIEAILFASGEPVPVLRIAEVCGETSTEVEKALAQLAAKYTEMNSAVCVQQLGECWQMCTRPAYGDVVQKALETKKTAPLSVAAMEVLTIVAYNQPVSKSFVEHVRGVDSSSVVNTLVEKELLAEAGRLDVPGRPIAYVTTPHFLRCFGLASLDDLPPLTKLANRSELETGTQITGEEQAAENAGMPEK